MYRCIDVGILCVSWVETGGLWLVVCVLTLLA